MGQVWRATDTMWLDPSAHGWTAGIVPHANTKLGSLIYVSDWRTALSAP
jgi:hypothetical protein